MTVCVVHSFLIWENYFSVNTPMVCDLHHLQGERGFSYPKGSCTYSKK